MSRLLSSLLVLLWAYALRSDSTLSIVAVTLGLLGVWLPTRRWLWLLPAVAVAVAGVVAVTTTAGLLFSQILSYVFVGVVSLSLAETAKDKSV